MSHGTPQQHTGMPGPTVEGALPSSNPSPPGERNVYDQFVPVRENTIRGVIHRRWRDRPKDLGAFLDNLEANPGKIMRDGGGQGITSRLELNGETVYFKIYRASNILRWLRDVFGIGRAMREWKSNCACEALGIRTARIEAALTRREGLRYTHYVLTAKAEGVQTAVLFTRTRQNKQERLELLRQIGRYVASLHRHGFWHAHLSFKHIYFTPEWEATLIDLERSMIRKPLPVAKIERNLNQVRRRLANTVPPDEVEEFERGYRGE